ncbi:alcohol dehydrogenase catalytic domain-containing protein [Novosphingobium sp.]|uniref:alcohol dehydrogenase catalytic domain-containing protein n=1 Tax=Novosphingobium sp. TaxID=1874826 RepID=UPI002C6C4A4A|nr:alcohol dehydrogenase catalytic domain-containing protein [Blastocatellia bacterium]
MKAAATMRAARMHEAGARLIVEELPTPIPGNEDVLIRVRSCGMVPNLLNVLHQLAKIAPGLGMPLPPLPAVFGLDPAGEVAQVGAHVKNVAVGDRVYVNPMRVCGTCRHCVDGDFAACRHYTFNGYFGFSHNSLEIYDRYPSGGMAEYMVAPSYAAVKLADQTSFDQAARLGYVGTAYSALRRSNVGPESTVLITGASGTLGLGGVISALALGAKRIFAVARDRDLLAEVKAISPGRIETMSSLDGSVREWIKDMTAGEGVDVAVDCLPYGAPVEQFLEAYHSVRRGGCVVNAGGITEAIPVFLHDLMTRNISLVGSLWFTPREAREMAALAESGLLDLSIFETCACTLDTVNDALGDMSARRGGFSNYVVNP